MNPYLQDILKTIRQIENLPEAEKNTVSDRVQKICKKLSNATRQLQIEAALERVRIQAMSMKKSEDLADTVAILFREFDKLRLGMLRCGIAILDKEKRKASVWTTSKADNDTVAQVTGDELVDIHPLLKNAFDAWLDQKDFSYVLKGEDLNNYYKALRAGNFNLPASQSLVSGADGLRQYYYTAVFSLGGIFAFRETEFSEEAKTVMKRFANVFNYTYTRFNDLKQVEAQARKAQIEASLERVRSSSLAMHRSNELKDVVKIVFENLWLLGIKKMHSVNINIFHEGSKEFDLWIAAPGQDYTRNFRLPYFDHPVANDFFDAVGKGQTLHKKIYSFDEKNEYFKYMFKNSDNKYLPDERKEVILNGVAYSVSAAISKHSSIFIHNYDGEPFSDEENDVLIRFSNVFDQAYARYLDLRKAEQLVRETVKQASLDRIRGQVASMRSKDDLKKITPLIWQELSRLDIPFIRCGVFIMDEKRSLIDAYLSTPDGQSLGVLHLPFANDEVTAKIIDHWRKKKVFLHQWSKIEFLQWMQSMITQGQIKSMEVFQGGMSAPESLNLHFTPFLQGMLYVGNTQSLSPYELDLIKSLAEAFSVAYARYEDFVRLEKAKHSIEATLTELRATQSQLIQSEKMASLGSLTAGIAHEIQNPLNFINNFSELNKELLTELKDKLEKGDVDEIKLIADDVIGNEEKVNYHGKRASAIVKGMLQHSRTTSSQKELTDINALTDEYLRLSYQGLRAKDKAFNAKMQTGFDEAVPKTDIIPQDIGRVLLNLYNNAFYAVAEKSKQAPAEYQPTVSVSTKLFKPGSDDGNIIQISVKDNGNGIPQKVIDKIFQPFFTTKPSGQGTGLGLSLSYDIVKAHGGELKVKTHEGEGSEFIIELPLMHE